MYRIRFIACIAAVVLPAVAGAAETPAASATPSESSIPVTDLIARVAKRTGAQFVLDPRVHADVPLAGMDAGRVDYDRLLAILRVNGLVAVPENGFVSIVPAANARQYATPTFTDLDFKAREDEVVTLMLTVKSVCAAHIVPVLRPLMPQEAHLAALPAANVLMINDRAANARRIGQMVQRLDRVAPADADCRAPLPN
jgi:general secretion pathway protein D